MPETNFNFRLCFIDTWIFEFSLFSSPRLPPELLVEEIVPAQVTGVLSDPMKSLGMRSLLNEDRARKDVLFLGSVWKISKHQAWRETANN